MTENLEDDQQQQESPREEEELEENDHHQPRQQQNWKQEGVLWKRRDVFKTKWRPRWFVLQPDEAVLTYYLLSRSDAAATSTISTPVRRGNSANHNTAGVSSNGAFTAPPASQITAIAHSVHSTTSDLTNDVLTSFENPVDYDVVPRGVIYLAGCEVSANATLSRPEEGLFVITIVPPNTNENFCHLAARTEEARTAWVNALTAVCSGERIAPSLQGEGEEANGEGNSSDNIEDSMNDEESSSWESLTPAETLFDNVTTSLAAKVEQSIEMCLDLCEDANTSVHWTPIFQNRDGVSAFQRRDLHGRVMMKSTATINCHPKQILNLIVDSRRRTSFEPNVATSERLEVLNPFTFLDYYSYKPVWPTSPRDFAVALHWQALQRRLPNLDPPEEALVMMALSCPEADELKGTSPNHVRATLHGSFYLLRLIPPQSDSEATPKCHLTRILSYNLGGSLPRNLARTVLMQQAGMPGVISKYLKRTEPAPDPRLSSNVGPMTNEEVIKDVLSPILQGDDSERLSSARRRLTFEMDQDVKPSSETTTAAPTADAIRSSDLQKAHLHLSPTSKILILMAPIILHRLGGFVGLRVWLIHPSVIFCISAFCAVRYIVSDYLGNPVALSAGGITLSVGPDSGFTSCNFSVELKDVLKYIVKKNKNGEGNAERGSLQAQAEVSVVHVVATALARAMQNHREVWNSRRVCIPSLFIDGHYLYPSSILDVSVCTTPGNILTLENFHFDNIQSVANALVASAEQTADKTHELSSPSDMLLSFCERALSSVMNSQPSHGRCLVLLSKTETASQTATAPNSSSKIRIEYSPLPRNLDVLLIVGEIDVQRTIVASGSPVKSQPRPILPLSLTINTSSLLSVGKCQAFAEDLQKLIKFPELCDD